MDHETIMALLQACWDAVWLFGPLAVVAVVAWRVAR